MKFGYKEGIIVIIEILIFAFTYGMTIFIVWSYLKLFEKKLNKFATLLTLCIVGFFLILFIILEFSTDAGYGAFYALLVSIFGFEIHMFVFCIIYQLITLCVKKLKIWIGLIIILALPSILCIYGFIIPRIFKIEKVTLYHEKYASGQQTTILQLSDVHLGAVYQKPFTKSIVKKIKKYNPDIVVITGDLFDGSLNVKEDWFEPFNELTMPILFTMGNHDTDHYGRNKIIETISKTKIKYLDEQEIYEFKGINFFGVDYDKKVVDTLGEMKGVLTITGRINILLLHVPQNPKNFQDYNIFLTLSGHTHDGQVFPGNLMAHASFDCVNGLYKSKDEDVYTYVSSGTGDTFFPMRTFTRAKIVLITIKGK